MDINDLKKWFSYHPPTKDGTQIERYERIRRAGWQFAQEIYTMTCVCEEKEIAMRKIREAVMWANAAIACNENKKPEPNLDSVHVETPFELNKILQSSDKLRKLKPKIPEPSPDKSLSEDGSTSNMGPFSKSLMPKKS